MRLTPTTVCRDGRIADGAGDPLCGFLRPAGVARHNPGYVTELAGGTQPVCQPVALSAPLLRQAEIVVLLQYRR
jgi:hypothetical protein